MPGYKVSSFWCFSPVRVGCLNPCLLDLCVLCGLPGLWFKAADLLGSAGVFKLGLRIRGVMRATNRNFKVSSEPPQKLIKECLMLVLLLWFGVGGQSYSSFLASTAHEPWSKLLVRGSYRAYTGPLPKGYTRLYTLSVGQMLLKLKLSEPPSSSHAGLLWHAFCVQV